MSETKAGLLTYVAQAGLKRKELLMPQPPMCWNYRSVSSHLADKMMIIMMMMLSSILELEMYFSWHSACLAYKSYEPVMYGVGGVWWCVPIIPALGRWRQWDQTFKVILCYILIPANPSYIQFQNYIIMEFRRIRNSVPFLPSVTYLIYGLWVPSQLPLSKERPAYGHYLFLIYLDMVVQSKYIERK